MMVDRYKKLLHEVSFRSMIAATCSDVMLAVCFENLQHEHASGSRGPGGPRKPRRFGGSPGRGRQERERKSLDVPIPGERPGRPPLLTAPLRNVHHQHPSSSASWKSSTDDGNIQCHRAHSPGDGSLVDGGGAGSANRSRPLWSTTAFRSKNSIWALTLR